MSIGVDAHHASQFQGTPVPAPVQIEAPRIGVDLDRHTVLGASGENCLNIHLVTRSAQQLPTGQMSQDSGEGIFDRADDAPRLGHAIEFEAAVHTCNYEVEAGED